MYIKLYFIYLTLKTCILGLRGRVGCAAGTMHSARPAILFKIADSRMIAEPGGLHYLLIGQLT